MVLFIPLALIAFAWSILEAKSYKYELQADVFKSERGVIAKIYTSIPYDRIQNVDLRRGIIDQFLGLTMLYIQTAGSSNPSAAEGSLPGLNVQVAEQLRDALIERTKKSR
jgi:uncharacterized membrane protein YdbT with pleckstrin-like domain